MWGNEVCWHVCLEGDEWGTKDETLRCGGHSMVCQVCEAKQTCSFLLASSRAWCIASSSCSFFSLPACTFSKELVIEDFA